MKTPIFALQNGLSKRIIISEGCAKNQVWFPKMYAMTKNGNVKWYEVEVHHFDDYSEIRTTKASKIDGKAQTDVKKIITGVNIGKANETTIRQQAEFEANSLISRLEDKGYKTTLPVATFNTDKNGFTKPMLAQNYSPDRVKQWGVYLQPKLNGVRCLATCLESGEVILLSRNGKQYYSDIITSQLQKIMKPGQILDGELYAHKVIGFQQIISIVKKMKTIDPNIGLIQLHVYDTVDTEKTFEERYKVIEKLLTTKKAEALTNIKLVETTFVTTEKQISKTHKKFVSQKYEGTMVRLTEGKYVPGYRSYELLKYKDFITDEFKIVGAKEATGRDAGTVVWLCQSKSKTGGKYGDGTFDCRPQGTHDERKKMWRFRKSYMGKKLTVKFQNLSDDGIPIFPTGEGVRDYE